MRWNVRTPLKQKFSFRAPIIGFLNIIIFIAPFMFLGKNYSAFSLVLSIFIFIMFILIKFIVLSSSGKEINTKYDLIILALSLAVSSAIYVSFMHLGYNKNFFNIILNLSLFLTFSIVSISVDIFWIIKWNKKR